MLSRMRAIVTPQTVINDCMAAVETTGLGRKSLMNGLPIDHFGFCVNPDDYATVSKGLRDMLCPAYAVGLSRGEAMMGQQAQQDKALTWYYRNPIPALVAACPPDLPLHAGGGYVAVCVGLQASSRWLQSREVIFQVIQLYGIEALWVPLRTPDWGVGPGYHALCVVTESLLETAQRLSAIA